MTFHFIVLARIIVLSAFQSVPAESLAEQALLENVAGPVASTIRSGALETTCVWPIWTKHKVISLSGKLSVFQGLTEQIPICQLTLCGIIGGPFALPTDQGRSAARNRL